MPTRSAPAARLRRCRLSLLVSSVLLAGAAGAQDVAPDTATDASPDPVELDTVRVNAYRTMTHAQGATKTDTPSPKPRSRCR